MKPIIAITMGDAAGIGPEIIVKALSHRDVYETCKPIVIGDTAVLKRAAKLCGLDKLAIRSVTGVKDSLFQQGSIDCIDLKLLPDEVPFGQLSAAAGNAAFHYIAKAVELGKAGEVQAICTAPLNKEALHKGGHLYPGHTEILAKLTDTEDFSMMLSTDKLKVIHLTTHVGLIKAVELITPERTYNVLKLADQVLRAAGNDHPRIALCGINPHAGEGGLFGNGEEEEKLLPAVKKAQAEGMSVFGPAPADTLFYRAMRGDFDIVVACYHDQGHTPVKVLGIEEGVNITVGLKGGIIRTSVDHGTAFDIAGKGIADERSLLAALRSAVELAPQQTV